MIAEYPSEKENSKMQRKIFIEAVSNIALEEFLSTISFIN